MGDRPISDDGEWMWTGSEWIPTPPNASERGNQIPANNQLGWEDMSRVDKLSAIFGLLIIAGIIASISTTNTVDSNQTYIQWSNVDDCLFQVELVATEGLVYREIVDYSDRVWWEDLDQSATKPYVFTITNLESSGPDCFTHQRLSSNGNIESEYFSLGPGEESVLTLH